MLASLVAFERPEAKAYQEVVKTMGQHFKSQATSNSLTLIAPQ